MLGVIIATAAITALIQAALYHRGRSYIYNLEQTAMNQAEELQDLRREVAKARDLSNGLLASNDLYRKRLARYEATRV